LLINEDIEECKLGIVGSFVGHGVFAVFGHFWLVGNRLFV
jgi:uncharacterized membrane protein YeaQ/YmgE (transglycosylase-associated protein family)